MKSMKPCPFKLHLEIIEDQTLIATIENISDEIVPIIYDDYWNPSRLNVSTQDGMEISFENVFPPVTPPSPIYLFIKPGSITKLTKSSIVKKNNTRRFSWASSQGFRLDPGTYTLQAFVSISYGLNALYDTESYEQTVLINNGFAEAWKGELESNILEYEFN